MNEHKEHRRSTVQAAKAPRTHRKSAASLFETILGASWERVYLYDRAGVYLYANPAAARALGRTPEAMIGKTWRQLRLPAELMEPFDTQRESVFATGKPSAGAGTFPTVEGPRDYEYTLSPVMDSRGGVEAVVCIARDVTELRQAEQQVRRKGEALAMFYGASQEFLAHDEEAIILQEMCRLAAENYGANMAWIALGTQSGSTLRVACAYGEESGFLRSLRLPKEKAAASSPTARALQAGRVFVANQLDREAGHDPWHAAALTSGYRAVAAFPLADAGDVFGGLCLYSRETGYFTPDRLQILQSFINLAVIALQRARLYNQVRIGHERLQALSDQLLQTQEKERRYLARELHDGIGQELTALKIGLEAIERSSDRADLLAYVKESLLAAEKALAQVRNLSLDLWPSLLDEMGLLPALQWYLERQVQHAGLRLRLIARPPDLRLPPEIEIVCFRVVQSALTNIVRHARAGRVAVLIRKQRDEAQLFIRENGIGFDLSAARAAALRGESMGLLAMEERVRLAGGRLEIETAPGRGTAICAYFPLVTSITKGSKG